MNKNHQWRSEFETGIAHIDEQNQFLCDVVQRLEHASTGAGLREALMEVYRHTREHFRLEEQFMRDIGFPDYHEHRQMNTILLTGFTRRAQAVIDGDSTRGELIDFMCHWFLDHIARHDQRIGEYFSGTDNGLRRAI